MFIHTHIHTICMHIHIIDTVHVSASSSLYTDIFLLGVVEKPQKYVEDYMKIA